MTHFSRAAISTCFAVALATSLPVGAADKAPGSGPNPYVDCGIGAALFPSTHWAAVTSNVIWDLGTTALTSATASPQTCSGSNLKAAAFIGTTYEQLAVETAVGQGEHLSAVLTLFGCGESQRPAAAKQLRSSMKSAVAAAVYPKQDKLERSWVFYTSAEQAASANCAG